MALRFPDRMKLEELGVSAGNTLSGDNITDAAEMIAASVDYEERTAARRAFDLGLYESHANGPDRDYVRIRLTQRTRELLDTLDAEYV